MLIFFPPPFPANKEPRERTDPCLFGTNYLQILTIDSHRLVKFQETGKKNPFPVIRHSWHLNCLSFTKDIKSQYQRWHLKLSSSLKPCLGPGLPVPEGFLSTLKEIVSSPPTSALHRTCFWLPRDTFWHQSDHLMIPLLHRLEAWKIFSSLNPSWLLEVIKIISSSSHKEDQILWNPAAFRS